MRLARSMGLHLSHDSLLDRIRRSDLTSTEKIRVLGVDDFAFRKADADGGLPAAQRPHC
jgi:hypothetical protein